MRTRNKRWAKPFIEAQATWIHSPGDALTFFHDDCRPKVVEIGIGKGQFFVAQAQRHPEWCWIGVEKQPSILAIAAKKVIAAESPLDVHLLNGDVMEFEAYIPDQMVHAIYLNFSDPWPKARHAKRRLTSEIFLNLYHRLLVPQGTVYMKTDNPLLYAYSLEVLAADSRFIIISHTADYQLEETDVQTEYEAHFRSLNQPIHRIIFQRS